MCYNGRQFAFFGLDRLLLEEGSGLGRPIENDKTLKN